eukprot:scaffold36705_cov33-Phaeocystis_antarctica.AAC.4
MILGSIDKLKGGGLAAAQGVASAVRLGSGRIDTQDNVWVTEDEVKLIDDYADSKAWGVQRPTPQCPNDPIRQCP